MRRSHPVRRVGMTLGLTAVLLLSPLPVSGGVLWDVAMGVGYAALAFAAALYLYPLRGEGLPHHRLFTLSQHRRIGWIALTLAALHTGAVLVVQPQVGHYLLPSAPLYMLLGLGALLSLAALVMTGLSGAPAPKKTTPVASVSTHAILAALLPALIAAHLIGSGQLIDTPAKAVTLCLLLALPLAWAALRAVRRRRTKPGKGPRGRPGITQSNRLLTTAIPCCAAFVALLLLPIPTTPSRLLQPAVRPPTLAVYFPHEKHTTVNCVTCHHNFTDKTGIGSCLDCHRATRATRRDLTQSGEATFHSFCRGCHTQLAHTTTQHGPTRSCSDCHQKEHPIAWATP